MDIFHIVYIEKTSKKWWRVVVGKLQLSVLNYTFGLKQKKNMKQK